MALYARPPLETTRTGRGAIRCSCIVVESDGERRRDLHHVIQGEEGSAWRVSMSMSMTMITSTNTNTNTNMSQG